MNIISDVMKYFLSCINQQLHRRSYFLVKSFLKKLDKLYKYNALKKAQHLNID